MNHPYKQFKFSRSIYLELPEGFEAEKLSSVRKKSDIENTGISLVENILKGTDYKKDQEKMAEFSSMDKEIKVGNSTKKEEATVYDFDDEDVSDGTIAYDFDDEDVSDINQKPKKIRKNLNEDKQIYLGEGLGNAKERADILKRLKKVNRFLDKNLKELSHLSHPNLILNRLMDNINLSLSEDINYFLEKNIKIEAYSKLDFYKYYLKIHEDGSVHAGFKLSP